ncbi:MAG: DNA recombination protein RmuC [Clostridia bacterium]|nr:DNA recombination protein RmuC [Clostridia bacterium]MBQ4157226.1 DNA recombination protein RmuC [Clostridia bacterium]
MIQFINSNPGVTAILAVLTAFALLIAVVYFLNKRQIQKTAAMIRRLDERVMNANGRIRASVRTISETMGMATENLTTVSQNMEIRQERMRREVSESIETMREMSDRKLDDMRASLDMSLQKTLETRLGESFRLVSGQLENVYRGIGEMKTIAEGVGDLKKVLTGVKTRGVWGEVRLRTLLEDTLTPSQYEENVCVQAGSNERVEFAVRLPGKTGDNAVLLPIDSKFPVEDYERLLSAGESGDKKAIEKCARAFETAIVEQARKIASKYIAVPFTTDFAIMFLPAESLYGEVLIRRGLADRLQREFHVLPVGPSTLQALLNCLQMGFQTVQMEKRSSEILKMLIGVKREFALFGETLNKARTRLEQAAGDLDSVGVRTRAMNRKLSELEGETEEIGE